MNFFCSWSGGKDSCLALYKSLNEGKTVLFLLNLAINGRSHGLRKEIIETQAKAIGIPLLQKVTTWGNYENDFDEVVLELKKYNITGMIAGDIDLEEHLEWIKKKSKELDIEYYEPLWKKRREDVLYEFVSEGFEAIVVNCEEQARFLLGMRINKETIEGFIRDTKSAGIDPCGENGEFHTIVIDGPIFKEKIRIMDKVEKRVEEYAGKEKKKWILEIKWILEPKL